MYTPEVIGDYLMKNLAKAYHIDADNYDEFDNDELELHESNRVKRIHTHQIARMDANARSGYRLYDERVREEEINREARLAKRTLHEAE